MCFFEVNGPIIWNWAHWANAFSINSFSVTSVFLTTKPKGSICGPHFPFIWFFKCVLVTMVLFSAGNVGLVFWIFMLLEDPNWGWDCNFNQFALKGYGRSAELGCSLCISGFMGAMISNLAFVFRNIFSKKGMKGNSVSGMNYYACLSMLSLAILTPFAIAVEGPQMWAAGWETALSQVGPQFIW